MFPGLEKLVLYDFITFQLEKLLNKDKKIE
jgi:hypothetical protein